MKKLKISYYHLKLNFFFINSLFKKIYKKYNLVFFFYFLLKMKRKYVVFHANYSFCMSIISYHSDYISMSY